MMKIRKRCSGTSGFEKKKNKKDVGSSRRIIISVSWTPAVLFLFLPLILVLPLLFAEVTGDSVSVSSLKGNLTGTMRMKEKEEFQNVLMVEEPLLLSSSSSLVEEMSQNPKSSNYSNAIIIHPPLHNEERREIETIKISHELKDRYHNRNNDRNDANITTGDEGEEADDHDELMMMMGDQDDHHTYTTSMKMKGTKRGRRSKRSVVHLYDMVVCATGCNPLAYKGYGCYCGFLGSGLTVDGIDRCCAKHDWCYHHAKCPPFMTYFVPYYWTCNDGRPRCVPGGRSSPSSSWKGACGAHLCECDRQFAECLRKFPCPRSRAMCVTSPWRLFQNLIMVPGRGGGGGRGGRSYGPPPPRPPPPYLQHSYPTHPFAYH